MASGVPVISSNSGGLPEVNRQGYSGYLSDVGDVEDMAKKAISILSDDKVLFEFKSNALKVAQEFDIQAVMPMYERVYQKALKMHK